MNQIYDIEWAHIAENDLKEIIDHIAIDSPANALKVLEKIKDRTSSLYTMPERCRIVPELKEQGITQYRELIASPWRIMFRIAKMKVYVLSVLDSRRNIEDILLKRLINMNLNRDII
ncbi:type II toxin-antitoxin system RelE/ParE family toxin [Desulfobacula phenolica]|uniref:Plasmid stabilization system protein ParE n=1 Tax=Desulfobacula phenolica TaxID=90732 RepID=A0A1H2I912_9BACT|nr:type II toxin-antitoxin system RelE/ParE family toxin [Desulfobacula phenolica]SDU40637.1 Plasmid stabilization system protein ParE [Desulfobacula phenolica]